jgi:hypothetical protein
MGPKRREHGDGGVGHGEVAVYPRTPIRVRGW